MRTSKKNSKKEFKLKKLFSKRKKDLGDKSSEDGFSVSEVVVIILISIFFGVTVGCTLMSRNSFEENASGGAREIVATYEELVKNYYGDLDKDELSKAAIEGMMDKLNDPHSIYIDGTVASEFSQTLEGSLIGIGVSIQFEDGKFRIVDVFANSPAEKAKVKVNDFIIAVNGVSVENKELNYLSDLIDGEIGTELALKLLRDNKEVEVKLKRGIVDIPSVYSDVYNDNIGYIKIDTFASNTSEQFSEKLKELEKKNIKSLILDVRGNTGGKLNQVNDILELFFKKKTVLYQIESKNGLEKYTTSKRSHRDYSVVVLVDYDSASAAEILASAFQEKYDKATIIGTNTYGKGTIQKVVKLDNGMVIKYTTEKWLTAEGKWLDSVGIVPDVVVDYDEKYYEYPTFENDLQLQKAIETLSK